MRILIDASVLEIPRTGVANALLGLYRACLDLQPSIDLRAVHRRPLVTNVPPGMRDCPWFPWLSNRQWRGFALPAAAGLRRSLMHFPWNGDIPPLWPLTRAIVTLHDVLPLRIPGYFPDEVSETAYRLARQKDLARAALVVTVSEFSKQDILRHFKLRSDILVIPPASTLDVKSVRAIAEPPAPYFLYVGGYDHRKGLEPLLQVFIQLHANKDLATRLVLVGERHYYSDMFRHLVGEATDRGVIEEYGYVSDQRLAELLLGARALIYPSKYEGFGLPPLEAMSVGCPVLTTRATSIPEVCGEAALYVEPDDSTAFGRAVLTLDRDAELRARLRDAGRRQAARFSWRAAAVRYLEALDSLS